MPFETAAMLATAALIFALATSYKLWFGPANRKPLLHKTKELLHLEQETGVQAENRGDHDEYLSDQVDPREHLSITNDDGVLSSDTSSSPSKENSPKS